MLKKVCRTCRDHQFDVEIRCPNCHGTGYDPTLDNSFGQCHACYGDGTVVVDVCPDCDPYEEMDALNIVDDEEGALMSNDKSSIFDVFEACATAIADGELIESVSAKDKEFHFQNWFQNRLDSLDLNFDGAGRNKYPDFSLVRYTEGYEIKGLAWPGREKDYDSNSQVPTGLHNGRTIFYVFGRYPADLSAYDSESGKRRYPVVDLVICHGDFLNADHAYKHKNKSVKGFGTYGDIMIRDRKMYVAPTPFALTEGTTGLVTLILPRDFQSDERFKSVGKLTRVESKSLVVGYNFDLRTNELHADTIPNPRAGTAHEFIAYRLVNQTSKTVSMTGNPVLPDDSNQSDDDEQFCTC